MSDQVVDPYPPNPSEFPLPQWATFERHNGFKAHKTLASAKTVLTVNCFKDWRRDREKEQAIQHGYLYEFVQGAWTLKYAITPGDNKDTHPLWAKPYVIKESLDSSDLTKPTRKRK